jgi:hypothetical protein
LIFSALTRKLCLHLHWDREPGLAEIARHNKINEN